MSSQTTPTNSHHGYTRVSFTEAVMYAFHNIFNYRDRATRAEYWWFFLFTWLGGLVTGFVDAILSVTFHFQILSTIFLIAIFFAFAALTVRRYHDSNHTGWWMLLPLPVTFIAILFLAMTSPPSGWQMAFSSLLIFASTGWLFALTVLDGTVGNNRYGPDPKGR